MVKLWCNIFSKLCQILGPGLRIMIGEGIIDNDMYVLKSQRLCVFDKESRP
jgi:hypothetical protein